VPNFLYIVSRHLLQLGGVCRIGEESRLVEIDKLIKLQSKIMAESLQALVHAHPADDHG